MYCTQDLRDQCYVLKILGVTDSTIHKDGSKVERESGPNDLASY